MRDLETTERLTAAETGYLVLATLPTAVRPSTASMSSRPPADPGSHHGRLLLAVVSQRLLQRREGGDGLPRLVLLGTWPSETRSATAPPDLETMGARPAGMVIMDYAMKRLYESGDVATKMRPLHAEQQVALLRAPSAIHRRHRQ